MIKILDSRMNSLGVIKNVLSATRLEGLNGENTLDFEAVLDDKFQILISDDAVFELDTQRFDLAFIKKISNEDSTYTVEVETEHVSYRLNRPEYNLDFFTETGSPSYILGKVLEDTGFSVGTVEFTAEETYSAQEAKSRRQILMEYVATLKGEVIFDNFVVNIVQHRGSTDVQAALKDRNIKVVSKTMNKRVLDEEGNPMISYECQPLYLPGAGYELGDDIMLIQKELGIMEPLRVVLITSNPYDEMEVTFNFANYVNGLEGEIYRIMTSAVAKDALYNGIRIGPEYGFEAIRNDKRARAYFRSDGFKMQSGDGSGEGWIDRLYFDPAAGLYVFDGKLSATMIEALEAEFDLTISNTIVSEALYAENAQIAELTVDRVETSNKVYRYKHDDTSPIYYQKMMGENLEFIEAEVLYDPEYPRIRENAVEEHLTNRSGQELYWRNEEQTIATTNSEENFGPVKVFKYAEKTKLKINFEMDDIGYTVPKIHLGSGDGVTEKSSKGLIYKDGEGVKLEYYKSVSAETVGFYLTDTGVYCSDVLHNLVAYGDIPPENPEIGDFWVDTTEDPDLIDGGVF